MNPQHTFQVLTKRGDRLVARRQSALATARGSRGPADVDPEHLRRLKAWVTRATTASAVWRIDGLRTCLPKAGHTRSHQVPLLRTADRPPSQAQPTWHRLGDRGRRERPPARGPGQAPAAPHEGAMGAGHQTAMRTARCGLLLQAMERHQQEEGGAGAAGTDLGRDAGYGVADASRLAVQRKKLRPALVHSTLDDRLGCSGPLLNLRIGLTRGHLKIVGA